MSVDYTGAACLLNSARAEILIDACDLELIDVGIWTVKTERGGRRYAVRMINGKIVRLHRHITDAPDGADVDHADGNGLNNRRLNLRVCTRSQNNYNTSIRKDNRSGFKGVYRHKAKGTNVWRARIKVAGRLIELGVFESAEAAAAARNQAAEQHHQQFARTT